MSSPAQPIDNSETTQTPPALFALHDFLRPGDEPLYAELDQQLRQDLAPVGILELCLVDEIRRAMWRLRRCGQVEENCATATSATPQNDPMQDEANAKIQRNVDRARAQSHRLLHKCIAQLRQIQTERHFRNEYFEIGADLSAFGLGEFQAVRKAIDRQVASSLRQHKLDEINGLNSLINDTNRRVAEMTKQTQSTPPPTPRNAPCPCGSGQKHKRCCGKNAPAVLHAA